ncbi:MAG: peptidoglycan-associated lipoprotein Pal [Desulfovermiculus sp.]
MRTYARMLALGIFIVLVAAALHGCARKQVQQTDQAGMSADESGAYVSNGSEEMGGQSGDEQMTAEEMEEYRLQERKRQKEAQADKDEKQEQKKQAEKDLTKRINFAFDSYELRMQARQVLKEKAEIMDRHSGIDLIIEGHCDERGTDEYNLALGERRARAAYEFLVLLGVDPERMSIISYGEERPLDSGHNEEAWAQNRRCEFRVDE